MANDTPPLEAEIRRLISLAGPMPIAQYMAACLCHPVHGYYMTRDPFGAAGDFITAPEISQMFGELIGLWAAAVWRQQMGSPENIRLVELGPGRGTMMADALRAAKVVPDFHSALVVHLVEISPALQQLQQQRLERFGVPMLWHKALEEVPEGPAIILANEFFDALPVHQAIKQEDGWHERVVTVDGNGNFTLGAPALAAAASGKAAAAARARCPARQHFRMAHGFHRAGDRPPRGAPGRRRAGDRLRAYRNRDRRHRAGGGRACLCQSAGGAGAGGSHRACGFPVARPGRRKHRRPHPWPAASGQIPPPPWHRNPRRHAESQSTAGQDRARSRARWSG